MSVPDLVLRLVRMEDVPALKHICWPEMPLEAVRAKVANIIARCERGLAWGLVALTEEHAVGYGQLMRWGRRGEISDLVVGEAWRGQGIGTAIVQRLLEIAREQGMGEVEIGAASSNPRAAALYQRLGFEEKRRLLLELGNGLELVIFFVMRLKGATCG